MLSQIRLGDSHLAAACCLIDRRILLSYGFELGYGGGLDDKDLEMRLLGGRHRLVHSRVLCFYDKNQGFREFFRHRLNYGRVGKGYRRKYGTRELATFPLLGMVYWSLPVRIEAWDTLSLSHLVVSALESPHCLSVEYASSSFGIITQLIGPSEVTLELCGPSYRFNADLGKYQYLIAEVFPL
jgi:hypothetical protein